MRKTRQCPRHEAEFNKRLHPGLKHIVIGRRALPEAELFIPTRERHGQNLIKSRECVHIVAEDAVKAHALNAELIVNGFKLLRPVTPQCERSVTAAHAKAPMLIKRHIFCRS